MGPLELFDVALASQAWPPPLPGPAPSLSPQRTRRCLRRILRERHGEDESRLVPRIPPQVSTCSNPSCRFSSSVRSCSSLWRPPQARLTFRMPPTFVLAGAASRPPRQLRQCLTLNEPLAHAAAAAPSLPLRVGVSMWRRHLLSRRLIILASAGLALHKVLRLSVTGTVCNMSAGVDSEVHLLWLLLPECVRFVCQCHCPAAN